MSSMTIIDIVTIIVAVCLVVTQFITVAKPLWAKMPKWLAVLMPVLIVCLPQIADMANLVKTGQGLIQLGIEVVALLVPAIVAAETNKAPAVAPAPAPAPKTPVSGSSA